MKISKADFPALVDFTINLEDRLIDPFIDRAFLRDVAPKIGPVLSDAITAYDAATAPAAPENPVFDDVNNTFDFDLVPIEEATGDGNLYNAVKPYWVLAAYHRHLLVHGIFHTPSGLTAAVGDKFIQITDKRRAEVLAMIASDMNYYEGEMMKYAKGAYPGQFADTCSPKKKNRTGLWVVGSRDKGCSTCGRGRCRC
jgi:hypothetical protein